MDIPGYFPLTEEEALAFSHFLALEWERICTATQSVEAEAEDESEKVFPAGKIYLDFALDKPA